jgi:hypothetical protein
MVIWGFEKGFVRFWLWGFWPIWCQDHQRFCAGCEVFWGSEKGLFGFFYGYMVFQPPRATPLF